MCLDSTVHDVCQPHLCSVADWLGKVGRWHHCRAWEWWCCLLSFCGLWCWWRVVGQKVNLMIIFGRSWLFFLSREIQVNSNLNTLPQVRVFIAQLAKRVVVCYSSCSCSLQSLILGSSLWRRGLHKFLAAGSSYGKMCRLRLERKTMQHSPSNTNLQLSAHTWEELF